jgi:hypothetical protein
MPVNYVAQDLNAKEIFRVAPSVYLIIAGRTREANIGSAVASWTSPTRLNMQFEYRLTAT